MTDVVIIGAGPAGLAAAERLAASGAKVTVLERQGEPGGTPRLCGHSPFGMREFHRVLRGGSYASRLAAAATRAGAAIRTRHHVTGIAEDLTVSTATPDGPVTFNPQAIILATGVREASRAERLLPGDRPLGVITTGALQDLWFARHALPFRRPVIYGRELVAMSAILTCREMGARPLAVIAPPGKPVAAPPFRWLPHVLGLPVWSGDVTDLVANEGRLAKVILDGTEIETDGLVLTGDWRPEIGMARQAGLAIDPVTQGIAADPQGRTQRKGVYACGNVLRGVHTAGQCWSEGRALARTVLADMTLERRAS